MRATRVLRATSALARVAAVRGATPRIAARLAPVAAVAASSSRARLLSSGAASLRDPMGLSSQMLISLSMGHGNNASSHTQLIDNLKRNNLVRTPEVETALRQLDRAVFCPGALKPYDDTPQNIGWGATITSPYMHAIALENLRDSLKPGCRALDIGSGSGLLSAAMALMVGKSGRVVGVDHAPALITQAEERTRAAQPGLLESGQLVFKAGDGTKGFAESAPYDCIHVGAAVRSIPDSLIEQLKIGGRMLVPVAAEGTQEQQLTYVEKVADAKQPKGYTLKQRTVMACVYSLMDAEPPTQNTLALRDKPQQLAPRKDAAAFAAAARLTNAQLEKRSAELSEQLKKWQAAYKAEFNKKPSVNDMLSDDVSKKIMAEYRIVKDQIRRRAEAASPEGTSLDYRARLKEAMVDAAIDTAAATTTATAEPSASASASAPAPKSEQ